MKQPFDSLAARYDHWYETPRGKQIYEAELKCLQEVCPEIEGRWLEVGVGSGRFANPMGIAEGLDPSAEMLKLAATRAITTYLGTAENPPFKANTFDGILLAFTLCFIKSAKEAMSRCHNILKDNGQLLIGLVPAESEWGKLYQDKKAQGHPIYKHAFFFTIKETISMAEDLGFVLQSSACNLFCNPEKLTMTAAEIKPGIDENAGFVALLFSKK